MKVIEMTGRLKLDEKNAASNEAACRKYSV
jgi:hypothetical protein